ncbi:D-2-hydroxyacid dehydrogenase [Candidatus Bathyarchaeota archaeon]|nr:D-2-hydroxyacid dehydrogenase [Candidatus Bathyarchaeota archaeon]
MPVKILVCDPVEVEGVERLRQFGFLVDVRPSIEQSELEKIIKDYDAVVVRSRTKVTGRLIEKGSRLKVIGRVGAGVDNIDLEAAKKRGIAVLNTPEAPADSVAELTVGLMLTLVRKISYADRCLKEGRWAKKELEGTLLNGKTLGLIGLGNIGTRVAKIAKALGMKILITKRTPPSRELLDLLDAKFVPLKELLMRSDIVSVHVPLTEQTSNMIGAEEFGIMKKGAILINTSRGNVIDENALLEALKSGKLGGAGLDVFCSEPPVNLELVQLPNVVCTPHIGAQTEEAQKTASVLLAEKIGQFFREHT